MPTPESKTPKSPHKTPGPGPKRLFPAGLVAGLLGSVLIALVIFRITSDPGLSGGLAYLWSQAAGVAWAIGRGILQVALYSLAISVGLLCAVFYFGQLRRLMKRHPKVFFRWEAAASVALVVGLSFAWHGVVRETPLPAREENTGTREKPRPAVIVADNPVETPVPPSAWQSVQEFIEAHFRLSLEPKDDAGGEPAIYQNVE